MTLPHLSIYLEELLQTSNFEDYCPNGLQVEGFPEIRSVATAVSANLETIEQAVNKGADALIVHHGIFWKRDKLPLVGSKKQKIKMLLENNLSLFGYHLPLDAHQGLGNNWKAAQDLGWQHLAPFGNYNGSYIGVKGTFEPLSREAFVTTLEGYYDHQAVVSWGGKKEVSSAALVSGGAYSQIFEAAQNGVDCFITGNFDEGAWHAAKEEGINFIALGHSNTEKVGPRALANHLTEHLGLSADFIDVYNPF
ncbi:MAG: Nif3-like dinuclear metal center hexameric protein [Chlamydiota bacterium]